MSETDRYYTPAEADELLPRVAASMRAIADRLQRARRLHEVAVGDAPPSAELESLRSEIEGMIDDVQSLGLEVKGLEPALVDFPALMNGVPVVLCWREGEDRVAWWHPSHTGFAGRQPLDPSRLGAFEWEN